MKTLVEGNIAYDEEESCGFIALGRDGAGAARLNAPAATCAGRAVTYGRWPVLAILTMFGLAAVYRYGRSREDPQWRWVGIGAVVAAIVRLIGSVAFSVYVRKVGSYNETTGALGGVIILLIWLGLSAFIELLGAESNSEMEHHTGEDTTTGDPPPAGHSRSRKSRHGRAEAMRGSSATGPAGGTRETRGRLRCIATREI